MSRRALDRWGPAAVVLVWSAGAMLSHVAGMWVGVGGAAIVLATALLVLDGPRLRPLAAPRGNAVVFGLLAGAFMTLATYPLYRLLSDLSQPLAADVARLYAQLGARGAWGWRALAVLPIVASEEIVWRGFVQSALRRRHGARAAVLLAAVLYALAHTPAGSTLLVALAFTCGLVWSAMRERTSGLAAPLMAHLLWDVVVMFVAPV